MTIKVIRYKETGNLLWEARKAKGHSRIGLPNLLGLTGQQVIYNYEAGYNLPNVESTLELLELLGVSVAQFLDAYCLDQKIFLKRKLSLRQ